MPPKANRPEEGTEPGPDMTTGLSESYTDGYIKDDTKFYEPLTSPPLPTFYIENVSTPEHKPRSRHKVVLKPPDGGWGWVVVFASFMVHVLADGAVYSFGILFVELSRHFKSSKGTTAWIVSILNGVLLGVGPLSSALTNRFGTRAVTMAGSLLVFVSYILSIFATDVTTLYVTMGVGAGLGFGLIYLPAIVSVSNYFEKRRAFATGIAVCGSGVGTFLMSPFTKMLVSEYGWKGAMLVIGGLELNCAVFGALFRPLMPRPNQQKLCNVENGGLSPWGHTLTPPEIFRKSMSDNDLIQQGVYQKESANRTQEQSANGTLPVARSGVVVRHNSQPNRFQRHGRSLPHSSRPMDRKDVFYRGSLKNLPEYQSNRELYSSTVTRMSDSDDSLKPQTNVYLQTLREMLDFRILSNGVFLLFVVSNFCTSIGFNVPYIYIVDRAVTMGVAEDDASFLLSVVGISNTISRYQAHYSANNY